VATGLTSLSRQEVTVNILFLLFAYCTMHGLSRARLTGRAVASMLLPLAGAVLLFLAIDILLRKSAEYDQPSRLQGFVYHLYWYLASPLAALNEFVTGADTGYHLGQNMFFPLYKWLCRLGLAPETEMVPYGEMVYIPYAANVYTYMRNFYEDFGIFGVAVVPYALGWAACAIRTRAGTYFPLLNLYLVLLAFIVFSFYNYFLFSNQVYLQVLFGFVFFRYDLSSFHEGRTEQLAAD